MKRPSGSSLLFTALSILALAPVAALAQQPVQVQPTPAQQPVPVPTVQAHHTVPVQQTGWYAKADVGVAFTLNTDLEEFFGPTPGSEVKFDPGVRFVFGGGYRVTDWFSAEAQTGVIANSIRSVTGANEDEAVFSNIPLLANVRFECPGNCPVSPFIGGGLGASTAILDADNLDVNGTAIEGSETDVVFAYQAFGGLRFRINDNMGICVEYHYFATTESEWEAQNISGHIRFGGTETHTATVAFECRF